MRITKIGKRQEDTLRTLDMPGFAAGYDAVIYNLCLPREDRLERIANAIEQTTERGVPAVLLHRAAHKAATSTTHASVAARGSVFHVGESLSQTQRKILVRKVRAKRPELP